MSDGAVVIAGGDATVQAVPAGLDQLGLVIAADGGLDLAERVEVAVDVVVGDMESVSPAALERAAATGVLVERSSWDKDLTDLELALVRARDAGARRLVVLGGAGGRLDHLLANLAVLTGPHTAAMEVEAWIGAAHVQVVRDRVRVEGPPGATVSLLAWHGEATGVTTTGLRWPLTDAVLGAGSAIGTSNVLDAPVAEVELRTGVATLTRPDATPPGGRMVDVAGSSAR
jgi:thiamine pyrophosphokinase